MNKKIKTFILITLMTAMFFIRMDSDLHSPYVWLMATMFGRVIAEGIDYYIIRKRSASVELEKSDPDQSDE